MIYNYYLDPEILSGEPGNDASALNVLTLLRGISENGYISIFNEQLFWEDDEESEFVAAVNRIENPDAKKKIKRTLVRLLKHGRIIDNLKDPVGTQDLLKAALLKAESESVDVAISNRKENEVGVNPLMCVLTNLQDYFISEVEDQRREFVKGGTFLYGGEESHADFLSRHFDFLMRRAQTIEIYDKLIGKGSGNFKESVKAFLIHLESTCKKPEQCLVRFHVSNTHEGRIHNLKNWLTDGTTKIKIELNVYGDPGDDIEFHHDRFLVIDDFAFMISRGFDFLHVSGKNKDINVDFKPKDKVMRCVRDLAQRASTTETITLR